MFVVVGLGNPGESYEITRHNVGFMAVDRVGERYHSAFKKAKGPYVQTRVSIQSRSAILVKPVTYMNLSGQAVRHVIDYYRLDDLSRLLIVIDDFHLPFGEIRLRPAGSAGGQKGLKSILNTLQTNEIARLRIGIGGRFSDASSFVLSPFNKHEQKQLPDIINTAADAIEAFLIDGIDAAMNTYNRNSIL